MKLQNHKVARTLAAAAVATCAVAMLSVGAFAADVAIGEKDPTYGGYGAPAGPAIQGNIMLIGADGAESDTLKLNYSVKGLFGRQVLYTARQNGTVLTLDVPASVATFRCTMEDLTTMMNNGTFDAESGSYVNTTLSAEAFRSDPTLRVAMREAAHHVLYAFVNSSAMNGQSANDRIETVTPWWQPVLLALEIVFGAAALLTAALYLFNVNKKEEGSHA